MIVISDLMGTLTTGSPVLGLVDWVRHNQSKTQARWLVASMLPGYLLAKSGLVDLCPPFWGAGDRHAAQDRKRACSPGNQPCSQRS